jgi:hypothetical protein
MATIYQKPPNVKGFIRNACGRQVEQSDSGGIADKSLLD